MADEARQEKEDAGGGGNGGEGEPPQEASLFEWVLSAVSAVLVAGMIGFIIYEGFDNTTKSAQLEPTVMSVERSGEHHLVRFRMQNHGDVTAAGVLVQGHLMSGDGQPTETSEVTLDYVPSHSETEGALIFRNSPAEYSLVIEAAGYQNP